MVVAAVISCSSFILSAHTVTKWLIDSYNRLVGSYVGVVEITFICQDASLLVLYASQHRNTKNRPSLCGYPEYRMAL